ncbi:MAG: DUF4062 domain-containing protein [Nitrospinota bacterium]
MNYPRVFISSVFRTLKRVRRKIHRIITDEFGWEVWWAEDFPELRGASDTLVRQVCFSGIDDSDLYICVLPNRYGDDRMGLAYTELEYHHAVATGIPTLVYRLRDSTVVDPSERFKQQAFLFLIRDRDIGNPAFAEAKTRKELYEKIRIELYAFGKKWFLGSHLKGGDFALSQIQRLLLPFRSEENKSSKPLLLPSVTKFNPDFVRIYLRLLDRAYEQSYSGAIQVGSALLDYMLSYPSVSHP